MLTRIDHVMVCVPDLAAAMAAYIRLGFHVYPGGVHTGRATQNAIAFHDEDYLELLSLRPDLPAKYAPGSPDAQVAEFLARSGGGLRFLVIQSDDLAADVAVMRERGVDIGPVTEGGRRTPEGLDLRWRAAQLGPRNPLPLLFLQHLTPLEERKALAVSLGPHPNRVTRVERAYIAVRDVASEARTYAHLLGLAVPKIQRGSVIKADMAVFDLGPTGLSLAQPAGPGPCADALARRGPGPFQVLHRTSSLGAAARFLADRGVPTSSGTRNTGEQALLVPPDRACGVYIGFVGPS
jgi:catechol 2,3-dioxygenase-like lactoylglutathione lyase family enzyme